MKREITPRMTEARARRLEAVIADPKAPRGRGPTGYACRCVGWTELLWEPDQTSMSGLKLIGERVTAAGWAALDEYRGRA